MFCGNPLAGLTDARGLDDQAMQSIAREFNFSETTFVTPPSDRRNTARLRMSKRWREALAGFVTHEVYPISQVDQSTWRVRMSAPGASVAVRVGGASVLVSEGVLRL